MKLVAEKYPKLDFRIHNEDNIVGWIGQPSSNIFFHSIYIEVVNNSFFNFIFKADDRFDVSGFGGNISISADRLNEYINETWSLLEEFSKINFNIE